VSANTDSTDRQNASVTALPGVLLLNRALIAAIFLWHGIPKALDAASAITKFQGFGLPGILGPIVGWVEVIAGILVLAGVWHRWTSMVLLVIILGALVTVQVPAGITAGLERDLLIVVALLVFRLAGPGSFRMESPHEGGP
jgi:putative oxidoreductase